MNLGEEHRPGQVDRLNRVTGITLIHDWGDAELRF